MACAQKPDALTLVPSLLTSVSPAFGIPDARRESRGEWYVRAVRSPRFARSPANWGNKKKGACSPLDVSRSCSASRSMNAPHHHPRVRGLAAPDTPARAICFAYCFPSGRIGSSAGFSLGLRPAVGSFSNSPASSIRAAP